MSTRQHAPAVRPGAHRRGAARLGAALTAAALAVTLAGCTAATDPKPTASTSKAPQAVRVGAFLGAGGTLLQQVTDGAGVDKTVQWLQVTDTGTAYTSLSQGGADAALVSTVVPKGYTAATGKKKVVAVGPVFRMADAFYSTKVTNITDLADGATVALPKAATDLASALKLLADADLITVTPGQTGLNSIATNSKNLVFSTVSPAKSAAALRKKDAVFLTANTAIGFGIDPKTAILIEPTADMTTEQLVTTEADKSSAEVKALYATLTNATTKSYITKHWKGIVAPVS